MPSACPTLRAEDRPVDAEVAASLPARSPTPGEGLQYPPECIYRKERENKTMNRYFSEATSTERDFLLTALADGARIGYDASGTTWAVGDESDPTLPEITFLDSVLIWASTGPIEGIGMEWKLSPPNWRGEGSRSQQPDTFGLLGDDDSGLALIHREGEWAVVAEGEELVWYPSPSIPADRIEEIAAARLIAV